MIQLQINKNEDIFTNKSVIDMLNQKSKECNTNFKNLNDKIEDLKKDFSKLKADVNEKIDDNHKELLKAIKALK